MSRVLVLHSYPPTPCLYGFEKGLRDLGHEVTSAGPITNYGDRKQFEQLEPECKYLPVEPDTHLQDIFAATGGIPDWVLYMHPSSCFLPRGLRDCPVPTAGWLTEEVALSHVDERLYPYFDLAPTAFLEIAESEFACKLGNRPCFNFITLCWLGPDPELQVRDIDVGFVGTIGTSITRERDREIEKLRRLTREGVRVFAHQNLFLRHTMNIYARSKIVFQYGGQMDALTFRVGEAMTAGAMVLARRPQTPTGGLGDHPLEEGVHLVYYDTFDQAREMIRYYLTHDAERRDIAQNGFRYIREENPWLGQVERFVREHVDTIPQDFLARRQERLARFEIDDRRERLDYARYYLDRGRPDLARRNMEAVPGWQEDPSILCHHAVACAFNKDFRTYWTSTQAALSKSPEYLAVHLNHAFALFPDASKPSALPTVTSQIETMRDLLARANPVTLDDDEIEQVFLTGTFQRLRLEVTCTYQQFLRGEQRRRRLLKLFSFQIHHCLGVLYQTASRWDDALNALSCALEVLPDDGPTMLVYAQVLLALDRRNEAVRWYERAVRAEPFFPTARMELASLLLHRNEAEQAAELLLDTLTTYLELDGVRLRSFVFLVAAYAQIGDLAAAKRALDAGMRELYSGQIEDPGHPIRVYRSPGGVPVNELASFETSFISLGSVVRAWEFVVSAELDKIAAQNRALSFDLGSEPG